MRGPMDFPGSGPPGKTESGFSAMELIVVIIVIGVMAGLAVKPLTGMILRIRLENAADGVKHHIMNARVKAMADPQRHCGVVFILGGASAVNDTVRAFLDKNPGDNLYVKGVDSTYLAPFLISRKRDKISMSIPSGFPSTIVFRGDGSANASAKIVLTLNAFKDTVEVLASTGRVRKGVK